MSQVNLRMSGGQSFRRRFYVLQADRATAVGNLTGFAVTLELSAQYGSTVLYTFTGSIVTAATALCQIDLSPLEVDTITDGTYWYRVTVDSGATSYKPLDGLLTKGAA